jgi:hypothetical protein
MHEQHFCIITRAIILDPESFEAKNLLRQVIYQIMQRTVLHLIVKHQPHHPGFFIHFPNEAQMLPILL